MGQVHTGRILEVARYIHFILLDREETGKDRRHYGKVQSQEIERGGDWGRSCILLRSQVGSQLWKTQTPRWI
jgi:hypothetical protein